MSLLETYLVFIGATNQKLEDLKYELFGGAYGSLLETYLHLQLLKEFLQIFILFKFIQFI